MRPHVRLATSLLLLAFLTACGQPMATAPTAPTALSAPTALAARPSASTAPSVATIASPTRIAYFDYRNPASVVPIAASAAYTPIARAGTSWLYVQLDDGGAQVWLPIGGTVTAPSNINNLPDRQPRVSLPAPAAPVASAEAAPSPLSSVPELLSEDALAQRNTQPGPAPRVLSAAVAAQPACNGSPLCQGMTNGQVEALAREAEQRGEYTEAARLRQYLPGGAQ